MREAETAGAATALVGHGSIAKSLVIAAVPGQVNYVRKSRQKPSIR